ncbi:MAG: hypothetical protein PVH02_16060, partial [Desulfobacteraceae bacterium]
YTDKGIPYRDIGMDVVATPTCVVSIKISGSRNALDAKYWDDFDEQLELARQVIKERYGSPQYSLKGTTIWWGYLARHLLYVFLIVGSAFNLSRMYLKKVTFTPSSTTRKYSVFIMILATYLIILTLLFSTEGRPTLRFRYEQLPHLFLVFLVHLWAFFSNRPKVVAFAMMLIVVNLFAQIVFWIVGWSVKPSWVGILISVIAVVYVFVKSSRSTSILAQSDKQTREMVRCCMQICLNCRRRIVLVSFMYIRLVLPIAEI